MVLRIFQMIATSGFLTALECTKFVFGRGSAPDPTGGAYSAPPDLLAWRERRKEEGKGRRGGKNLEQSSDKSDVISDTVDM